MAEFDQPVLGHYYFPDYYEKKLASLDGFVRASNANNEVFPNGIRLVFNRKQPVKSKINIDSAVTRISRKFPLFRHSNHSVFE